METGIEGQEGELVEQGVAAGGVEGETSGEGTSQAVCISVCKQAKHALFGRIAFIATNTTHLLPAIDIRRLFALTFLIVDRYRSSPVSTRGNFGWRQCVEGLGQRAGVDSN